MKTRLTFPLAAVLLIASLPSLATVFRATTDRQLVERADAVVIGTVLDSLPHLRSDGYVETRTRLVVEQTLKGDARGVVTIAELGGVADDKRFTFIADSATYAAGDHVMVFLRQRPVGTWYTASMTLGKFVLRDGLAVRESEELGNVAHPADAFVRFVRDAVSGLPARDNADPATIPAHDSRNRRATTEALRIAPSGTASTYALQATDVNSVTHPVRWPGCVGDPCSGTTAVSVAFKHTASDPGGIAAGLAAWTNDPASFITMSDGGVASSAGPAQDGQNFIYLDYGGAFSGPGYQCDGAQACTIGTGNGTNTFDGDTWFSIADSDIIVAPGIPSGQFPSIIAHELGHAIGIRHSNQGSPSSFAAIMTSPINPSFGSTLQQWDKDAVDSLYGNGPVCTPPSINSVNGGGTVPAGSMANLSVNAAGSATLSYQWYSGSAPSTANPVGTNSPSYQTPPINTTSNFWVRASNGCGTADSSTITVTPAACVAPTITVQPVSQTIASGGTADLQIGHTGSSPFTYQWYQGASGDTSNPVPGANQRTFTTPALTQTTSFWASVSNGCGFANSAAATITIPGTCTIPSFTVQPQSLTLTPTTVTFLFAKANNVIAYNWFKGSVGDISAPIAGSTPSNTRYVQQLYTDLLGRAPDAGAAVLVSALNTNALTRGGVAAAILASNELHARLITTFYATFLHRAPLPVEISFWVPAAFTAGLTDEQIGAQFLGSPEYFALAGGSNTTWLNHVFGDLLGRAPSSAESTAFLGLLGGGSRTVVALSISNSDEARGDRVKNWYNTFLRRPADASSLSAFTAAMAGGQTDEQVIAQILATDEYFNFGTVAVIGPLSTTTTFWVQAVNACGSANSLAAVMTIPQCTKPVIVTQPQNATINIGATAPLAVYATGATSYQWYAASSGDESNPVSGATGPLLNIPINATGIVNYWVKVTNACGSTASSTATLTINCVAPIPQLSVQPTAASKDSYIVAWAANNAVAFRYDLQESATADFAAFTETHTTALTVTIPAKGAAITTDTRFYYRVRMDPLCGGEGAFSPVASVLVTAPPPPNTPTTALNPTSTPCTGNNCTLTAPLFIQGFNTSGKTSNAVDDTYTVTSDKPFLAVTPASGTLPPGGLNLTATVDTSSLDVGSTQATLTISRTQNASGKIGPTAVSSSSVPVSVNLVTPISPVPKDNNPPANTLLIPAVAHAAGIGSHFQSDVRITNTSAQSITYQLNFTPTAIDGTTQGKTSTITIAPGDTKALNDLVATWCGAGSVGEGGLGTLEIRPQNFSGKIGDVSVNFATVASSRTYNVTPTGTFGQFIPAMTLTSFLGKSNTSSLSLQQVAQTASSCTNNCFRTNFGFVEGAGQNADMILTLFNADGTQAAQKTLSLLPFEHIQQNLSSLFPGTTLTDGRLQVQVTSDGGKVTAYASVLDNVTSDPLLVFPVDPSKVSTNHIVVPGVAELNNGAANFHSDMRIFNGGTTDTTVTLNYTSASVPAKQVVVPAGQIVSLNNTLNTLWGLTGSGGAIIATTDTAAPLVITARTYSRRADGGTFGQFIPGVTSTDATGLGERPLQVVQLEQSPAFRSNLGLVEVTGNAVDLDIQAFTPDSKVAAHYQAHLEANQFNQIGSFFTQLGLGNTYNGRVAVSVVGGSGRVAAYGSVIDALTQDPTYVPAQ